jgi:hypothetical protein
MGGRAVLSASTSTVSLSRTQLRVSAKGKSQNRKIPGKAGPSYVPGHPSTRADGSASGGCARMHRA